MVVEQLASRRRTTLTCTSTSGGCTLKKEMAEMLRLARINPGKMPSAMVESCIDWMAEVWGNRALHDQAREKYKYTGATNALDGTEDHLIAREARVFWDNLGMSAKRDAACHDVRVEVEASRLRWGYDAVYSLVAPFPSSGRVGPDGPASGRR